MFKVCDEPHPLLVKSMLGHCEKGNVDEAYKVLEHLWTLGYSPEDIIGNIFRVCKTHPMAEYLKLEFIKVRRQVNGDIRRFDSRWHRLSLLASYDTLDLFFFF